MHGQAVLEAVHPAGVLRHVAADAAGELGGGVGGVEQAVGRGGVGDRQVAHPRLHHGGAGVRVDAQDAAELAKAQDHAAGIGQGAAGKAGAGAPRDDGHAHLAADLEDGLDLARVAGQGDHGGQHSVAGKAVVLIGAQAFDLGDQGGRGEDGAQAGDQGRGVNGGEAGVQAIIELVEHDKGLPRLGGGKTGSVRVGVVSF